MTTSTVEDAEAERRVHGEPTEPVPARAGPGRPDDRPLDEEFEFSGFTDPRAGHGLPGSGLPGSGVDLPPIADPFDEETDDRGEAGDDLAPLPGDGGDGDADQPGGAGELDPASEEPAVAPPGRGRRGRGRVPVPA